MPEPSDPAVPPPQSASPRLLRAAAALLVVAVLAIGAWQAFEYAKLHLALRHAREALAGRDFARSEFWIGRVFGVDPRSVDAMRLMADISEVQDHPDAISWRLRIVQRNPGDPSDALALAKCAWRFGQTDMAAKALATLPREFTDRSGEYHELIAGTALANHQTAVAEAEFQKAAALDPNNPVNGVNLAAFRLANSPNPGIRSAAIHTLESALSDPRVSVFAVRSLLADALHRGDIAAAQRYATKLHSIPGRDFSDDLSCLDVALHDPAFAPDLREIEARAAPSAPWATETGDWLNAHGLAAETLHWFPRLAPSVRSDVRVQMTQAQAFLTAADWRGLQSFLATCEWNNGDFLKRAMLVRCKRELSQPWQPDWRQLVADCEKNPPNDLLLAHLIIGWNWRSETIDLLWGATTRPETESQALQYLWQLYSQTKDTNGLRRVAKAQLDLDPANPAMKNNEAFLSLLLYGASESSERLAQEATAANPNIPEWAATYAYALHLAGKESQARQVMQNLPAEALRRPGVALYYAIILAANGDLAGARQSFAKLNPVGLLPEEQKLAAGLARQLNVAIR